MTKIKKISEVWLKASILGSTWAASEIILGSFLHNLRIPFNGTILTAIGFILMIAASYKWKDKGLFWRSGLICALMKTMSPSAVIFGPMIAIFMEAVLLEVSVRIMGRNALGFLLGATLAMSWVLVQKIGNFIISYGFNIVDLYAEVMRFAGKQLHIHFDLVWLPIVILLVIYILFGFISVVISMKIGKSLLIETEAVSLESQQKKIDFKPNTTPEFPYSIFWLIINFIVLIGMLFLINMNTIYLSAVATIIVLIVWTQRYKRGLRQLSKPSFWVFFAAITMISAFAITSISSDNGSWVEGLIIGLQMNFRAAIVVVGFSVLGTELYNPKIRNYFTKTSFKQLPIALELAFESLPYVIASLPDVKSFFKKPVRVIKNLIFQAEKRLQELQDNLSKPVFIISGAVAAGKTTFVSQLIEILKTKNITIGGFYAPRLTDDNHTIGYDLVRIQNGERLHFLTETNESEPTSIGRFKVNESTYNLAQNWLDDEINSGCKVFILDEVGKWELNEKGWKNSIDFLLSQTDLIQIWTVRDDFVADIINQWQLKNVQIFESNIDNLHTITNEILAALKPIQNDSI